MKYLEGHYLDGAGMYDKPWHYEDKDNDFIPVPTHIYILAIILVFFERLARKANVKVVNKYEKRHICQKMSL